MKVVFDALSQVGAGSRTYLKNVLPRLEKIEDVHFTVLWPAGISRPAKMSVHKQVSFVELPLPQKPPILRFLYEQCILPVRCRNADVLFSPVDIAPFRCQSKVILAIRNPNPFYDIQRSFRSQLQMGLKKWLITLSAQNASRVIFVSHKSRNHIASQVGLSRENTHVIYHGLDHERFQPRSAKGIVNKPSSIPDAVDDYLLCVSTIYEHKNFEILLRGYEMLPASLRSVHPLLIVGGVVEQTYFHSLQKLIAELDIEDHVRFVGSIPYLQIHEVYQHARAFILPSLLETFGHTLVEAMACGVPVVAADATCIPEILDGAGLLFSPYQPRELADHLESILTNQGLQQELIQKGVNRARDFTWDQTVSKLGKLLAEVGGVIGE